MEEFGLIGFDDQEVIGLFFFHQVSRGALLGLDRIGGHQGAPQVQIVDEFFETGHFVGFGGDLDLPATHVGLGIQGTKELEGLAIDLGGRAHGFAIDGQRRDMQGLQVGPQPRGNQGVELLRVEPLQDAANGAFAGGQVAPGLATPRSAQAAELVLIQTLREGPDINQRIVAGDDGGRGEGHDRGHAPMPPALIAARVFEGLEGLDQTLGLVTAQGILLGIGGPDIARPGRRQPRRRQDLAGLGMQFGQEDGLGFWVELIEIQAGAAEAFGQADLGLIGRSITSAFEPLGIDVGFDQQDRMAIALEPVRTEYLEVAAQDVGSPIGGLALGLEHHEARVTSHQMPSVMPLGAGPTDPDIPRAEVEGGTGPPQQRDPLALLFDDIAQGFAHQTMLLEIVMFADELIPARDILRLGDEFQREFPAAQVAQGFADEILGFGKPSRFSWTNHAAQLGSLGAICHALSSILL